MSAAPRWGPAAAAAAGVEVRLRTPVPERLALDAPTAIFLHGAVTAVEPIASLRLTAGEGSHPALSQAMPSPTLAAELGRERDAGRAIFWGILPLTAPSEIGVTVELAGGEPVRLSLGAVDAAPPAPSPDGLEIGPDTVVICMATHEPPAELLERQLDSLRGQTHGDWACVISDDASSAAGIATLERLVGGDRRFAISRSPRRAGVYENFHRALGLVPPGAGYVALCDQDDEWYPEKLEVLLRSLGDARLVFSDMRLVDRERRVLAGTYWTERAHNHASFASLLLGNTVTGAASLLRRELLDDALPLPPRVGNLYHDHWLALVARATGRIAYVDRPLYDYVQHPDAVIGHAGANRGVVGGSIARRLAALRHRPPGSLRAEWRWIHFAEYCRLRLVTRVLLDRLGPRIDGREARTLQLFERGGTSPVLAGWLALRQLRRLRRDDTLGSESGLLRGLAWSAAMGLRRRRPDRFDDADLPAGIVGPETAQPPASVPATER